MKKPVIIILEKQKQVAGENGKYKYCLLGLINEIDKMPEGKAYFFNRNSHVIG